ncbi:MAG: hypothetical protein C0582_01060 [Alphaproteobacteria bacterium]|nr:MAG: hypothetical protein C0582_01060 [Alphaproteobacteria bacterium]
MTRGAALTDQNYVLKNTFGYLTKGIDAGKIIRQGYQCVSNKEVILMRNFYLFTVVGLTALGASALSKADLPDRPQIKEDGFVMRLMEALNGKLEPKPRPDTTVVARVDLTQKPLQRKSYSFDVALKTGQKMTVKVTGDRYDLQHYLKVTLTQAFSEKEALNLDSARALVADAARNAPVILLGYSLKQPSSTQLTVDLNDLPLKKVNVQGPKDKATAAVLSMIQTNLDNQPFTTRYAVQNLIKNLQALPGYQGTKVTIAPDAKNESVILTVQLKKAEEHHIGYLFKNDLSTKVGPLNNTLSFSANNAFTDHDNLNLYTILSQEPKNLWGMGMNYNYLLSDSGIRHGIMVNRFNLIRMG